MPQLEKVNNRTMISENRLKNFLAQIDYIVENTIDGCVVECGVWRGGAICLAKSYLKEKNDTRNVYAFDSFEGLPPPSKEDYLVYNGLHASHVLNVPGDSTNNCRASIEDFKETMNLLSLTEDDIVIQKGWFEETTKHFPEKIAILRFDGDYYKSTLDVLENMFDKVVQGGVVIFDDYGYWNGNKQAVDEFFMKRGLYYDWKIVDGCEMWFVKK